MKRILSLFLVLLGTLPAAALISIGGTNAVSDLGWPTGSVAVANLPTRVGFWEGPPLGGGEYHFLYRGQSAQFNEALRLFSQIQSTGLTLLVHEGPQQSQFLRGDKDQDDTHYDWDFTVWLAKQWEQIHRNPRLVGMTRSDARSGVPTPRIELFVRPGGVDWRQVQVPTNVQVRDLRPSALGFDLATLPAVKVNVTDLKSGRPLSGVQVVAQRMLRGGQDPVRDYETVAEATTDQKGAVTLERLPLDRIHIIARAEGMSTRSVGYEQLKTNSAKVYSAALVRAATVTGEVRDEHGNPLGGVKMRASSFLISADQAYPAAETIETLTDSSGKFVLTNVPAGLCQVWPRMAGYYFGDVTTMHTAPTNNLVLTMIASGRLKVQVRNAQSEPLARWQGNPILVEIEPKGGSKVGSWGGSAELRADGTYEFSDMPPGEYKISSRPNPGSTQKQYAEDQWVKVEGGRTAHAILTYK